MGESIEGLTEPLLLAFYCIQIMKWRDVPILIIVPRSLLAEDETSNCIYLKQSQRQDMAY
jgi:hypothetical protein